MLFFPQKLLRLVAAAFLSVPVGGFTQRFRQKLAEKVVVDAPAYTGRPDFWVCTPDYSSSRLSGAYTAPLYSFYHGSLVFGYILRCPMQSR